MTRGTARRGALGRSVPLIAGLMVLAATSYLMLIISGRLLGAARFSGLSALYVLVITIPAGLFLPLELEIARRRGHERGGGGADRGLVRRAASLGIGSALVIVAILLAAHAAVVRLLNGDTQLLASLCVALPGYAACFVSRGVFAGSGELGRYGLQLGVEGSSRLLGVIALAALDVHDVGAVGWLFGAAPWIALAASLLGRSRTVDLVAGAPRPLVRPLGWLLVSSLASQVVVNAGPLVIQLLTTPAQRAQAGAFLAALVIVRIPIFLFTAVQPSFLPAMAAHAAGDRRAEFGVLLRRVLGICAALTAVTAVLLLLLGPFALRLLFGFHHGLGALVFLAMGVSVGLFLTAAVLAQALLGRSRHAATTLGWLVGLVGLGLGTIVSGSPVDRATTGFLCGALASALTFAVLLGAELRTWSAGRRSPARHRRMAEQPARPAADTPPSGAAGIVEGGDSLALISTLGADTAAGSASVAASGARLREPWWRPALRLVLALGIAAAIGILWWRHEPRSLSAPIDIIGYPTFVNYDYAPTFLAYRLVVWEFPVVTLVLYALLGWRGPLRRRSYGAVRRPIALRTAEDQDRPTLPVGRLVSICARLALPVIVIAIEADTHARLPSVDLHGAKYGLAYGATIVCAAALAVVVLGRRADRSDRWWALRAWGRWIGLLNGLLAGAVCLVGLWLMTRSTSVYVRADQTYHYYPWLPWWAGLSLAAMAAGWALWRLVRRRDPARIEALTLKVVVGSVFVFLATSAVPQALGYFQGYDDSQWLAGARALKEGGFPWRDFYVIHGLFYDVFQGSISLALFGNSVWGARAGIAVVILPLAWVGLYLFAVWVCRRNAWLLIFGALLLVSGVPSPIEQRFILVPLALVLFGETVARRSAPWCVALAVTMFVLELIVPETLYVSIPILLALPAADFLHRDRERPLRAAFRRTYWVLGAGAVLCAIWAIFLAINHALHAFIEYYVIFGPGHDASGAIPPVAITTKLWVQFALGIGLVLITYLAVAVRLRNRTDWTPRQWVAVAAAGFAALYGEKALGRLDTSHLDQTFTAALPLLILQADATLTWADRIVRKGGRALRSHGGARLGVPLLHPVTALTVVVVAALILPIYQGTSVLSNVRHLPAHQHRDVALDSPIPHVGYAQPGALDANLVSDLSALLDTYAPPGTPVFDMTNSPGYFQYLFDRDPGTRFIDISMAIPGFSQQMLIDDLERTRPPVVVYPGTALGLPRWDGVQNQVRHYLVSRYVLQNYTPIVGTHNEIIMLRNDLLATAPPVPPLLDPSSTENLYFQDGQCDWGDIPNFLPSTPVGQTTTLPVEPAGSVTHASGWAVDPFTHGPVSKIYFLADGKVVGSGAPLFYRAALAQQFDTWQVAYTGFSTLLRLPKPGPVSALALTSDGMLHPLSGGEPRGGSVPQEVKVPGGRTLVVGEPILGKLESVAPSQVGKVSLPPGADLASFDLLTVHAAGALGSAQLFISDKAWPVSVSHQIVADSLPSSGDTLSVRVGSCMPWYGYGTGAIYIVQTAGAPITRIELSDTR